MRPPRRHVAWRVLCGISFALLGVTAMSSVGTSSVAGAASRPPVALAPGSTYVALGSSFASGPGIPNQLPTSCARSDHDYPHLVAAALHLNLVDVSCAGATTANLLSTPQRPNPPQIDAVTPADQLVTVTVGGNDLGYTERALACGSGSGVGCSLNPTKFEAKVAALRISLLTLIGVLKVKAPSAAIVLVTYPRVVPATGTCPALSFTRQGKTIVSSIGKSLEGVFLQVVKQTGVRLADPYPLAAGHGPCAPAAQRWTSGAAAVAGFPYHPTENGHIEMASLVETALRG